MLLIACFTVDILCVDFPSDSLLPRTQLFLAQQTNLCIVLCWVRCKIRYLSPEKHNTKVCTSIIES
jgi:hypothetical protein